MKREKGRVRYVWRAHPWVGGDIGEGKLRRSVGCNPVGVGNVVRKVEPDTRGTA